VSSSREEQTPTNSPSSPTLDVTELESKLGYRFRDSDLLQQALTHKSFSYEIGGNPHNESMEFLGDAVLGFLVTDFLYHDFPDLSEGRKSKIKAFLVSASTLSRIALELDIPRYLRLGKGEEKTGGRKKKALAANAFEAVIAAIYLDSGIEEVRRFLDPLYRPLVREVREGSAVIEDPKTALQEYLQARNLQAALYGVTAETGPEHRKTFHVELRVGARKLASATGPTKKTAELHAAQTALSRLIQEERDESGAPGK
jgi:ribonuclease-3